MMALSNGPVLEAWNLGYSGELGIWSGGTKRTNDYDTNFLLTTLRQYLFLLYLVTALFMDPKMKNILP